MTPEETANADQGMTYLGESLPPLWRKLYENCIAEGFTELQAMQLVRTYIHGNSGGRLES